MNNHKNSTNNVNMLRVLVKVVARGVVMRRGSRSSSSSSSIAVPSFPQLKSGTVGRPGGPPVRDPRAGCPASMTQPRMSLRRSHLRGAAWTHRHGTLRATYGGQAVSFKRLSRQA